MLRALIFDFDGLILDTETPLLRSWREVFDRYRIPIADETVVRLADVSREPLEAYQLIESSVGEPIDRGRLQASRFARESQLIAMEEVLPGVESLMLQARLAGLKIGLASSSSLDWVGPHLARLGLQTSFDSIRCKDHVARVKPHPDLYLGVLRDLDVKPGDAVALEDSPTGAEAARRAGIVCVAIPNPATASLTWGPVDLKLDSLHGLRLDRLHALVSSGSRR